MDQRSNPRSEPLPPSGTSAGMTLRQPRFRCVGLQDVQAHRATTTCTAYLHQRDLICVDLRRMSDPLRRVAGRNSERHLSRTLPAAISKVMEFAGDRHESRSSTPLRMVRGVARQSTGARRVRWGWDLALRTTRRFVYGLLGYSRSGAHRNGGTAL